MDGDELTEIKNMRAHENCVFQIPTTPTMTGEIDPLTEALYSENLEAGGDGIIAKDAFVFAIGKHPSRNLFVFYRKDIGDVTFDPEDIDPLQVEKQDWMEKSEED